MNISTPIFGLTFGWKIPINWIAWQLFMQFCKFRFSRFFFNTQKKTFRHGKCFACKIIFFPLLKLKYLTNWEHLKKTTEKSFISCGFFLGVIVRYLICMQLNQMNNVSHICWRKSKSILIVMCFYWQNWDSNPTRNSNSNSQ